ncbi:MAG: glucan biosynthesis protein [Candidatus Omnitrophica bacterium]|nr:glucan biosynthesis protein [Candidatus Omnitrophota bacterium]
MNIKIDSYQRMVRRLPLILGLFGCLYWVGVTLADAAEKDKWAMRSQFQDVVAKAKALSKSPFQEPGADLPDVLKKMGYDQWRGIRFKPARSLWLNQPFSVQFFHPGFLYQHPVIVHYIDQNGTHQVPFSSDLFEYTEKGLKAYLPQNYGFAGLRIHYPLNTSKYADELVAFLGASYFRALGRDQGYGLSARGLAVNTAQEEGEEFPLFREFWIVHPSSKSKRIKMYALLDSNSVTGAYEFLVEPGEETLMKVNSVLFIRQHIQKIGIAPLNSMFFYGKNSDKVGNDFRPEVHDSDGLLVNARSGEWIWHPLVNPSQLLINAFGSDQPFGFGLEQRDVDFDHYQDLEARYERRPSVWVSPKGDWGRGHVELVQIPTDKEYNDNIVAYWVPERSFEQGDTVKYAYSLSWYSAQHQRSPKGFVQATRIVKNPNGMMFIIEFSGDGFKGVPNDKTPVPDVWVSKGARLTDTQLIKNTVTGGWRLLLHITLDTSGPMELNPLKQKPAIEFRAFLKDKAAAVTETWSYTYLP